MNRVNRRLLRLNDHLVDGYRLGWPSSSGDWYTSHRTRSIIDVPVSNLNSTMVLNVNNVLINKVKNSLGIPAGIAIC